MFEIRSRLWQFMFSIEDRRFSAEVSIRVVERYDGGSRELCIRIVSTDNQYRS